MIEIAFSSDPAIHQIALPENSVLDMQEIMALCPELTDAHLEVLICVEHYKPVTIVDRFHAPLELTVTLQAHGQGHVNYRWVPSDDDHKHSRVVRTVRADCCVQGSSITIECFRQTNAGQLVTLTTQQQHSASHTTSNVKIHGVSSDTSRMNVESLIRIEHGLAGVSAHQVHKHLLLDRGARATSNPMLEVLSDDVVCSHGAAIRYLDADQLFYLQSRGLAPDVARKELVNAFLSA